MSSPIHPQPTVTTNYLPATDYRPARISVILPRDPDAPYAPSRREVEWDYSLTEEENHLHAALEILGYTALDAAVWVPSRHERGFTLTRVAASSGGHRILTEIDSCRLSNDTYHEIKRRAESAAPEIIEELAEAILAHKLGEPNVITTRALAEADKSLEGIEPLDLIESARPLVDFSAIGDDYDYDPDLRDHETSLSTFAPDFEDLARARARNIAVTVWRSALCEAWYVKNSK